MTRPKFYSTIEMTDSSVVEKVQYDPESYTLDLKLSSGGSYRYRGISARAFAELVTTQSPGKIYNDAIRKDLYGNKRHSTKLPRKSWRP